MLDEAGVLDHRVSGIDNIEHAMRNPPSKGRARIRGAVVRRLAGDLEGNWYCCWDRIFSRRHAQGSGSVGPLYQRRKPGVTCQSVKTKSSSCQLWKCSGNLSSLYRKCVKTGITMTSESRIEPALEAKLKRMRLRVESPDQDTLTVNASRRTSVFQQGPDQPADQALDRRDAVRGLCG